MPGCCIAEINTEGHRWFQWYCVHITIVKCKISPCCYYYNFAFFFGYTCNDVVFSKVVQEEISIPSSFVKLSYLSSRTPGYKTLLRIILTHAIIPSGMTKVHLIVAVEGRLLQKWFPAAANLVYTFAWNKTDIYGQKVSGLAEAMGM